MAEDIVTAWYFAPMFTAPSLDNPLDFRCAGTPELHRSYDVLIREMHRLPPTIRTYGVSYHNLWALMIQ